MVSQQINSHAFFACNQLKKIRIPKSVKKIGKEALGYESRGTIINDFKIKGYKGTAAEKYAKKNGFKFFALN